MLTEDEAFAKLDQYGDHGGRLEPFHCEYCGYWHLRSHWKPT